MQLGLTVVAGVATRKFIGSFRRSGRASETLRQALNRVVLWVTMPVLVFQTVHAAPLGPDLIQAPAAAIAGMAGTTLVAWLLLVRLYGKTPATGGLVLAASAGSVSFFGIPIVRALFGPDETRVAVYFAVLNVPLALLFGAIIGSRVVKGHALASQGIRGVARLAFRQLFTVPATWALFAGLALNSWHFSPDADQALKARNSGLRCFAAEPASAPFIAGGAGAVTSTSHKIQGTGYALVPPLWQPELVDGYLSVTDEEAIRTARLLATREGVFGGFSGGANVAAATQVAWDCAPGTLVVTVIPDTGLKYLSTDLYPE